ncbi:MAG: hypothetical protein A4E36_00147 [Methanoregulaceae archaeon PtaB.Bin009]|nr:MAG: hypothetical protein A4E36_00147 [Methanoregulaceae archaeon PtaB.Bin009]
MIPYRYALQANEKHKYLFHSKKMPVMYLNEAYVRVVMSLINFSLFSKGSNGKEGQ